MPPEVINKLNLKRASNKDKSMCLGGQNTPIKAKLGRKTRKSSCVTARDIPPTALQVLVLPLLFGGEGGCEGVGGATAVLSWLEGRHLSPALGAYHSPNPGGGGYPSPVLAVGYPCPGVPPPGLGYDTEKIRDPWYPSPPPPRCGQTDTCENSTFPILRMRAVKRDCEFIKNITFLNFWRYFVD